MKITVKKTEKKGFENVEIREVVVNDMIKAEVVSGKNSGMEWLCALLAQIATFDGKKLVMEDLLELPATDFLELQRGFMASEASLLANVPTT